MPNETTLQENLRTPLDGTEWVRLSTGTYPAGVNWKAQLSSILFTLSTALPPANGNLDFYVATTGSDSNPGTIGSPFATIQHATNVAAGFDYQNLYLPTIHVADGTYVESVKVPHISSPPSGPTLVAISYTGNASTPGNCVVNGTGTFCFQISGEFTGVKLGGFLCKCDNTHLWAQGAGSGFTMVSGNMSFDNSTVSGDAVIFYGATLLNSYIIEAITVNYLMGNAFSICDLEVFSSFTIASCTVNYPAGGLSIDGSATYFFLLYSSGIDISNITTNANLVTGHRLELIQSSSFTTNNGTFTEVPGSNETAKKIDGSCFIISENTNAVEWFSNQIAGLPTSGLDAAAYQTFSDTTAGGQPAQYANTGTAGVSGPIIAMTPFVTRVSSQFNKTSDVALANISGLTVNVAAAGSYEFQATLFTTSNAGGGVQAAIGGTCTATAIIYEGQTTNAAAIAAQTRAAALATSVGGVTAVTAARIDICGLITVNAAGTLTVQFAQNNSNGTASSVLVGSYFNVKQIA